jgi:hypothetical protein
MNSDKPKYIPNYDRERLAKEEKEKIEYDLNIIFETLGIFKDFGAVNKEPQITTLCTICSCLCNIAVPDRMQ